MPKQDTSDLLVMIFSGLAIVGGGVGGYLSYAANEDLKSKTLPPIQAEVASAEKRVADSQVVLDDISSALGWQARVRVKKDDKEITVARGPSGPQTIGRAMNAWADIVNGKLPSPKYTTAWPLVPDEEAKTMPLAKIVEKLSESDVKGITVKQLIEEQEGLAAGLDGQTKTTQESTRTIRGQEVDIIGEKSKTGEVVKKGTLAELIESKDTEIASVLSEIESLRQRLIADATQKEREILDLNGEIQRKQNEAEAELETYRQQQSAVSAQIAEYQTRIDQWTARSANTTEGSSEADGKVLRSDPKGLVFWIDVGRRDGLTRGVKFEVFGLLKGARRIPRGQGEVIEIMDDFSKCAVVSLVDGRQPVEEGDMVANDLYERNKPKVIAFAGRLIGKYTNEEATKMVSERGALVREEVGPDTNYLVIGKGYERDKNFERASALGVKIIREKDLFEFFQIR